MTPPRGVRTAVTALAVALAAVPVVPLPRGPSLVTPPPARVVASAGQVPAERVPDRAAGRAREPVAGRERPGASVRPRFGWPLSPTPTVTRPFDAPDTPYGAGHRGIDLAAFPGQQVRAAAEGFVVFAGPVAGRGVVSLDHDGGLRTTYQPVRPSVSVGERVHRGQVIGTVSAGHAGCPAEACLHWGVRRGTEYLDPLRLVVPDPVLRLKPWEGAD